MTSLTVALYSSSAAARRETGSLREAAAVQMNDAEPVELNQCFTQYHTAACVSQMFWPGAAQHGEHGTRGRGHMSKAHARSGKEDLEIDAAHALSGIIRAPRCQAQLWNATGSAAKIQNPEPGQVYYSLAATTRPMHALTSPCAASAARGTSAAPRTAPPAAATPHPAGH